MSSTERSSARYRDATDVDREQLILDHLPLLHHIVGRTSFEIPGLVQREDLFGWGMLGLIESADSWDIGRGLQFSTFAYPRIRGAILDELRRLGVIDQVLLQSFDRRFLAAARQLCPELSVGLLGPAAGSPSVNFVNEAVVQAALDLDADLVHWHAPLLRGADVDLLHDHDLLVCTYTSDDELAWSGGSALGVDAMCTNDPARMIATRDRLARQNPAPPAPTRSEP